MPTLRTKETVKILLDRANDCCSYCGDPITTQTMSIDHMIPKSKGGSNDLSNLAATCVSCNALKSDMTLEEYRDFLTALPYQTIREDVLLKRLLKFGAIQLPKDKVRFFFEPVDPEFLPRPLNFDNLNFFAIARRNNYLEGNLLTKNNHQRTKDTYTSHLQQQLESQTKKNIDLQEKIESLKREVVPIEIQTKLLIETKRNTILFQYTKLLIRIIQQFSNPLIAGMVKFLGKIYDEETGLSTMKHKTIVDQIDQMHRELDSMAVTTIDTDPIIKKLKKERSMYQSRADNLRIKNRDLEYRLKSLTELHRKTAHEKATVEVI